MIPYIAIIIVLIVSLLWQIYTKVDNFTGGSTDPFMTMKLTDNSTMQNTLDTLSSFLEKFYELKELYGTRTFKPNMNEEEAKLLGFATSKDSTGKVTILGDTSVDTIRKKIKDEIQVYETQVQGAQNDVKSGAIRPGAKIVDKVLADSSLTPAQAKNNAMAIIGMLNANNELVAKKINVFFDIYYKQYPPSKKVETPAVAPVTAVTTVATVTPVAPVMPEKKDTSAIDLGTQLTKPNIQTLSSQPAPITKEAAILTNEKEMELVKKITKQVNEEVLSQLKNLNPIDNIFESLFKYLGIPNKPGSKLQGYEYSQESASPIMQQTRNFRMPEQPFVPNFVNQFMPDSL